MLNRSRKRTNLIMTLLVAWPLVVIIFFALFFSNRMQIAFFITLVGEIILIIAFVEARRVHKKILKDMEAYNKVGDYVNEQLKLEKQRRREEFIKDSNKPNMLDAIYFEETGVNHNTEVKKENGARIVLEYVDKMNKNSFNAKARLYANKKNLKFDDVIVNSQIEKDTQDNLDNPDYKIRRNECIKICLALHLNFDEANDLLKEMNYRLDKTREYDLALSYFFDNGLYDINYVNLALLGARFEEI